MQVEFCEVSVTTGRTLKVCNQELYNPQLCKSSSGDMSVSCYSRGHFPGGIASSLHYPLSRAAILRSAPVEQRVKYFPEVELS
jgi:hypothetical protein